MNVLLSLFSKTIISSFYWKTCLKVLALDWNKSILCASRTNLHATSRNKRYRASVKITWSSISTLNKCISGSLTSMKSLQHTNSKQPKAFSSTNGVSK